MSDDVPGHEQLEHGRHLHKGKYARQKLSHTYVRNPYVQDPNKPKHVAMLKQLRFFQMNWKIGVVTAAVVLVLLVLLFRSLLALALALAFILVDVVVEMHKLFTEGIPVDFEILSLGTAIITAHYGILAALVIILIGPFAAELSHGHLSEFIFIKHAGLLVTGLASLVLGPSSWGIFIAVLFGLITQYIGMQTFGGSGAITNFLRRFTNACLNAYIIFFLLPLFFR